MTRRTLDLETYSEQDIREVGLFRYVEDPSFEVLLYSDSAGGHFDLARGRR